MSLNLLRNSDLFINNLILISRFRESVMNQVVKNKLKQKQLKKCIENSKFKFNLKVGCYTTNLQNSLKCTSFLSEHK